MSYKVSFINQHYRRSFAKYKDEFFRRVEKMGLEGQWLLGDEMREFEENFAKFVGTKFCVALNSGHHAIYLALKALGIKGLVALPSHTFKATCAAVLDAGAVPILYDMDQMITGVQARIPVHIAGELSSMGGDGAIIEDACQAIGAVKNPTSDAQCWSFYPAKIGGGCDDGGALTTNREDVYDYVRDARNHFKETNKSWGGTYRMGNLRAAYLNVKFKDIDWILARRKEIAERYLRELRELEYQGFIKLPNNQNGRVWQDFIVQVLENE